MVSLAKQDLQKEMLAGNQGQCTDYRRATDFGRGREPFTWLSSDGDEDSNLTLAARLRDFKRSREAVGFEAWELEDERWRVVFGGAVVVIYVEMDARLPKVRALLQWAPDSE
ncbi:MAG: hypothetical protein WD314_11350 [Trueperaceae bacterium]